MSSAMVGLANITLASAQATVTFGSIPATGYRDLLIVCGAASTAPSYPWLRINGDTGSNYSQVEADGTGSAAYSYSWSDSQIWYTYDRQSVGTDLGVHTMHFLDYSATDKHKTVLLRIGHAGVGVAMTAGRWASTSAINSIVLNPNAGGGWAAGSTFALYGIVS